MGTILETKRTYLRTITWDDKPNLSLIFQDAETMYAYEHAFSDEEVHTWIERIVQRQESHGHSLWAIIRKEDEQFLGLCGILDQELQGQSVLEIGYLLNKNFWHMGFASEAAQACKHYAFRNLNAQYVYSFIRDMNAPSKRVALKNRMTYQFQTIKQYYGMDMVYDIFRVENPVYAFPKLYSERVLLTVLTDADTDFLFHLRSQEAVVKYSGVPLYTHRGQAEDLLSRLLPELFEGQIYFWILKIDDTVPIGTVCLWNPSENKKTFELGYELDPQFQGKGYMREAVKRVLSYAFEDLHLQEIIATPRHDHTRSRLLLEHVGFALSRVEEEHCLYIITEK